MCCKPDSLKNGSFQQSFRRHNNKKTDHNLALSTLLSAPTHTIYMSGDMKKSESKTEREGRTLDAPRQLCWRNNRKPHFSPQICSAFGASPWWDRGTNPVYQPCTTEDCMYVFSVAPHEAMPYHISIILAQKREIRCFRRANMTVFSLIQPSSIGILAWYFFCSTGSVSPGPVCCHLMMFPEKLSETKRCW